MVDANIRFDELIAALKKRNFRLTPQRVDLVRLIAANHGHPSARQLYARIKHQFPTMSHATVYKTLSVLKEMGQVLEIGLRDDSCYNGNRPEPHPHQICTKSSRIVDGELKLDPAEIRKLGQASGYSRLGLQISFYGLCPDCKKESV